ncbi:MAG TPA: hypothetical protein VEI97_13460, partial [bacterium]|nr:hypothetical protein [bacterium]
MALRLWRLTQVLLAVEFVLLLGVFASCQGGPGGPAPTVSQEGPKPIPPGLVLEHAGAGGEVAGQGTFGFFKFTLDPVSHRATLEPIARAAGALGDPYNVDITGFLAGSPCTDCFRVDGVGLTPDMYPYVDFSLRHPFPLPRNNPAGPNDRLDLAVYDVKGIFLKPDPTDARYMGHFVGIAGPPQQPSTLTVDNSGFLAGITLDGITDAFDPYTDGFYPTTASAHPYILMHEDTRATTFDAGHPNGWPDHRDPIGHNVFPQGGGPFIRRVVFTAQPGDVVEYLVVLTANFASASTGKGNALGQRANPITYLPWANSKAPWRVKVTPQTNGLQEGDPNSRSTLQVDVFDWQHHLLDLTVVPSFRVENQARNSLLRPSKVTGVRAAVPGVADEDEIQVLATGGSGTPQDPLTYLLQIYNRQDADAGTYLGAIRVEDEYEPGPTAEGVGRGLTPFYLRDSSTYLTFSVEVEPAAEDPVELGSSGSSVYNGEGPAGAEESIVFDARSAGNLAAARQLSPERPFVVCEVKGTPGADGADIVLCTSPDGGNSFSVPRRVTAGTHAAGDQTAPDVAVTPDGLTVHVTYQHTGADGVSRVYYARSADQGLTFPVVLEVNPSAPGQQFNPSISVAGDNPNLVVV